MTFNCDNFLGLPAERCAYEQSRFAVLPIPYDSTTSFLPGTRHGPRAIITASQQLEPYDHELEADFTSAGISTLEALAPNVDGPQAMLRNIRTAAARIVRHGKFLISLGGEHTISSALVQAVKSKYKNLSVLQIDAHADLRQTYEGSRYSHATVMRRIHDLGVPFCGVGIRSCSASEARFAKRNNITPITARECMSGDDWLDRALDRLTEQVYITVDIDGFDPACAPGTGTPEPGGLDWYTVDTLLHAVAREKTIAAADIVEVMPLPGQVVTEFTAAKVAYRIISYAQAGA